MKRELSKVIFTFLLISLALFGSGAFLWWSVGGLINTFRFSEGSEGTCEHRLGDTTCTDVPAPFLEGRFGLELPSGTDILASYYSHGFGDPTLRAAIVLPPGSAESLLPVVESADRGMPGADPLVEWGQGTAGFGEVEVRGGVQTKSTVLSVARGTNSDGQEVFLIELR